MKVLNVCVFALIAFFNLIIASEIPQSSTLDGNATPLNMTTPGCNPSFVMPSSCSSLTKTKRKEDGKFQETKTTPKSPAESSKAKLYKVKKQKPKPKVTPQPCKYPGSRPCITQKEIDQGWHDKKGCYNRSLFFTYGITHCWEEGDDCVKPDCRY